MKRILVKFPSRERPQRFLEVLQGFVDKCADRDNVQWLFSFDQDDRSMVGMVDHITALGIRATVVEGWSRSKVHAINRDIDKVTDPWDILLVISDDMHCQMQGWDQRVRHDMESHYPDGDGTLWYFDGHQGDICTLPCMDRTYYDRTGFVYHPSYTSVFPDNEAHDIAFSLGKIVFVNEILARHIHPANVNGMKPDALYRRNETTAIWKKDEANYRHRKSLGFP
jgi:hypothetical protein